MSVTLERLADLRRVSEHWRQLVQIYAERNLPEDVAERAKAFDDYKIAHMKSEMADRAYRLAEDSYCRDRVGEGG